jgi:hypothetical protein
MKIPRFRIGSVMVVIGIVAVDIWPIRSLVATASAVKFLLAIGALPMANILVVALMRAKGRHGSRSFSAGFLVFGGIALALYVALTVSSFSDDGFHGPSNQYSKVVVSCLVELLTLVERYVGSVRPLIFFPVLYGGIVVLLGAPQLAFALMGGFMFRMFKITISRR